jgi:hypothetical protein
MKKKVTVAAWDKDGKHIEVPLTWGGEPIESEEIEIENEPDDDTLIKLINERNK